MAVDIVSRLCPLVECKVVELIGNEINENSCLSVVSSLDKFHRRLQAVQRLLLVEEQWSPSVIMAVAKTVTEKTACSLQTAWALHLQQWGDSWKESNQPHDSAKQLEASLVELIQRAFVALMVIVSICQS